MISGLFNTRNDPYGNFITSAQDAGARAAAKGSAAVLAVAGPSGPTFDSATHEM